MINGKHGQGPHRTKMGADKSAKNTSNAPTFICPNCLPKPKSLGFWWKKASWLGVRSPWNNLYEFEDWPSGIAWNPSIQTVLRRDEQGYRNRYNIIDRHDRLSGNCNLKIRFLILAQLGEFLSIHYIKNSKSLIFCCSDIYIRRVVRQCGIC